MKAIRWSDDDHYFGPFTYAKDKYRNLALVLGSGDDEDYPHCRIRVSAFGHTLIAALPPILRPWRQKCYFTSAALIHDAGRQWYWDTHEREYGFSYGAEKETGGFLQVFLGPQTHDSRTTQSWACSTPWNNWRHVRHSLYDLRGNHFATEPKRQPILSTEGRDHYERWRMMEDLCPSRTFCFTDFDGQMLTAKTLIEERQWEYGTGWFRWLAWFRKPKIRRSLDITFSGETGKRKGSWKGGTIGCGIDMLPGELHMDAFIRYCEQHEMTYKGVGVWLQPTPQ